MNLNSEFLNQVPLLELLELRRKELKLFELKECEMAELAYGAAEYSKALLKEDVEIGEILAILSADSGALSEPSAESDSEFSVRMASFLKSLGRSERALFVDLYLERLSDIDVSVSEMDVLPECAVGEIMTYVKSALADEAYDVFSQEFSDPKVFYSVGFKEAVEAVLSDRAQYAILPFEEKGGARIPGVLEMIYSNDLKIVSVTPVFGFDGTADIKYALVAQGFNVTDYEAGDDRFLEILVPENSDCSITELLGAAESYGSCIHRVDTVRIKEDGSSASYVSAVLKTSEKTFLPILLYMILFCGDCIPVGIYKNLE